MSIKCARCEEEEESGIPKCARCGKEVGVCYYVFGDADPYCRNCYASAMAGEEWKNVTPEVREKSVQNIAFLPKWAAGFWVRKTASNNRALLMSAQQAVPAGIIIEQNSSGKLDVSCYIGTAKVLVGTIDIQDDGWHHYIVQRDGDSLTISGENGTLELTSEVIPNPKGFLPELQSDLMEETGSIRCIKCEEKIVGTHQYILGNDYAHCNKCYIEVGAEIAKACLTAPVLKAAGSFLPISPYLPESEGEAPLAIFTPSGLIRILNEDKVSEDFWRDTSEVNEYITCDCADMKPGVYRAVLAISNWRGHEGDWDSELTLFDVHQYDFKTSEWVPEEKTSTPSNL
jgi:hypothetical protein